MVKVLLAKPVYKLGETGEVVDVAAGYARNYLFPKQLAVQPTEHNVRALQKAKIAREAELREREEQAKLVQEKLEGATFNFERTASEEGSLYGSVRQQDIVAAVAELTEFDLERDRVKLSSPIDTVGTFPVVVNLYKDINANVTVVVEADNVEAVAEDEAAEDAVADDTVAQGAVAEAATIEDDAADAIDDSPVEVSDEEAKGQEETAEEGDVAA